MPSSSSLNHKRHGGPRRMTVSLRGLRVLLVAALYLRRFLLLNKDLLTGRVQGAVHLYLFAFELLHFILMVDVVGRAAGGILQHVFVALFHDRAGETLTAGRIGLSLSARCLLPSLSCGRLICRLLWCLLGRLLCRRIGRLRRSWRLLLWRLLR